jgi:tight adherence protein C
LVTASLLGFMALGAVTALALWVAFRAAFPPPVPLAQAIDRLNNPVEEIGDGTEATVKRRLGRHVEGFLESLGVDLSTLRQDAAITETPLQVHLGTKITAALIGPIFVTLAAVMLVAAGIYTAVPFLLVLMAITAAVGFFGADAMLHQQAEARRNSFRVAFTSWLNLVWVAVGTGLNYGTAMRAAAGVGDSWSYQFLRRSLDITEYEGIPVATVMGRLSDQLGVKEPAEFARQIGIATDDGARIRQEIAAKAEQLGAVELARIEAKEQSNTVRMIGPGVLLGLAFMILIGFPAISTIFSGM